MPEHAEPAARFGDAIDGRDRPVDAEILMILGELLDKPALGLFVGNEILDEIKQALRGADAANGDFEAGGRRFAFAGGSLPFDEMFIGRKSRADPGLDAVRDNDGGVVSETCGMSER
jgi:hypothetical protein